MLIKSIINHTNRRAKKQRRDEEEEEIAGAPYIESMFVNRSSEITPSLFKGI